MSSGRCCALCERLAACSAKLLPGSLKLVLLQGRFIASMLVLCVELVCRWWLVLFGGPDSFREPDFDLLGHRCWVLEKKPCFPAHQQRVAAAVGSVTSASYRTIQRAVCCVKWPYL